MLNTDELKDLLEQWKKTYGKKCTDRQGIPYYKIESKDFKMAMPILVKKFVELGYDRKEMTNEMVVSEIQIAMTPHTHPKLAQWRIQILRFWMFYVTEILGSGFKIVKADFNFKKDDPNVPSR